MHHIANNKLNNIIGIIGIVTFICLLVIYIILANTPANNIDYTSLTGISENTLQIILSIALFAPLIIAILSILQVFKFNKARRYNLTSKTHKSWLPVSIILSILIVILLSSRNVYIANTQSAITGSTPTPISISIDSYNLFKIVNSWRLSNGYKAYQKDNGLCKDTSEIMNLIKSNTDITSYFDNKVSPKYINVTGRGAVGFKTNQEILAFWTKDETNNQLKLDHQYACIKCNENKCYMLSANIKSTNNVSAIQSNIDCVGPDGKHFQTNQKACDEFNAAWGKKKEQPASNSKTIVIPKYTNTTIKTIPCVLSVGVYQLSESDCAFLKIQESSTAKQPLTISPVPTPNFNTNSSNYIPADANTLLNNCINNAVAKYNQRMNELSAHNTSDSSVGNEALNTANSEISQCYSTYQ